MTTNISNNNDADTDLEDISSNPSSSNNIPGYSAEAVEKVMKVLQIASRDVDPSLSKVIDFSQSDDPSLEFAELRHASHVRLCASNKAMIVKLLQKQKRLLSKVSLTSSRSSFIADATKEKIQHAHEMVQESKNRVRERALCKFKMERELALSRQSLLASVERHTDLLKKRDKERDDKILAHRQKEARRKLDIKKKNDLLFKQQQEIAKRLHEQESKERREKELMLKAKQDLEARNLQKSRHDWRIKKNNDKKLREEAEKMLSDKRLATALKRMDDTNKKDLLKKAAQEDHRLANIKERDRNRRQKQALVLETEMQRQLILQKIQEERNKKIQTHAKTKAKEANDSLLKIEVCDT